VLGSVSTPQTAVPPVTGLAPDCARAAGALDISHALAALLKMALRLMVMAVP
jgi:hypothetical protein